MKKTLLIAVFVGMSHGIMSQDIRLPEKPRFSIFDGRFVFSDVDFDFLFPEVAEYTPPDNYSDIENSVQEAVDRAKNEQNIEVEYNVTQTQSGGIRFDNYSSVPTVDKEAYRRQKAAEQAQREQRDAERAAFYAKRRAQMAEAAARAAAEQRRKEEERMRIFNNEYNKELQRTAGHYACQHAVINQRTTTGRDYMMNYRVAEKMESSYTPSIGNTAVSASDIIGVIPKRLSRGNPPIIILSEHAVPNTGQSEYDDYNYNEVFDRLKEQEKPQIYSMEFMSLLDKLKEQMDGGQIAAMEFFLRENNHGKLPELVGKTESGRYVFESDDGQRVFSVSPNGLLVIATFNEKDWKDENIIAKIYNGEFLKDLKDGASVSWNGGSIKIKDLKNLDENALRKLLPQLKAQMKLTIVDNSSTLKGKAYYLEPQDPIQKYFTEKTGVPFSVNSVYGVGVSVSAGGEVKMSGEANATPVILHDTSPLFLKASVKASEMEAKGEVTAARVIRMGNRYFFVSGNIEGELGIGYTFEQGRKVGGGTGEIEVKSQLLPPFPIYAGTKIGGTLLKDITPKPSSISVESRGVDGDMPYQQHQPLPESNRGHGGGGGGGR